MVVAPALGADKSWCEFLDWETFLRLRATEVVWPSLAELTASRAGMGWAGERDPRMSKRIRPEAALGAKKGLYESLSVRTVSDFSDHRAIRLDRCASF
jgi:hypothetical protein